MGKISTIIMVCSFCVMEFCCTQAGNVNPESMGSISDTVVKDIPKTPDGDFLPYYSRMKAVEKMLNLENIEDGFDSMQVRIWFGYASYDTSQLIILRNSSHTWNSEVCSLIYRFNETRTAIDTVFKICSNPVSTSNWDVLSNKLTELCIPELPDWTLIPEYPLMTEGNGLVIETATKKSYRTYSYAGLKIAAEENIKEAKLVSEFITTLEKELSFKTLKSFF